MSKAIAARETPSKRPLLISLIAIGLWFQAGLLLILIFPKTLGEEYASSVGRPGSGILLSGILTIYLVTAGIGLWFFKKWGVLLTIPLPTVLVTSGLVGIFRSLMGIVPANSFTQLFTAVFCFAGGLGWISELWKFWQQITHNHPSGFK